MTDCQFFKLAFRLTGRSQSINSIIMSKQQSNSGTKSSNSGSNSNPNYPSTTGNPSGGNRGNTPKGR